ncbi:MAG TPA: aldolase/citrate lyase family protein [Burkholderiaceae bacterium]
MHPSEVLFQGDVPPALLPVCDHYAGSEKLMRKSIALQQELGPIFDLTFDCEDGASAGHEAEHARLVGSLIASADNRYKRIGARVHDAGSRHFERDVAVICEAGADKLAYLVLPKPDSLREVERALRLIDNHARPDLPVHVLIETHGALRDAHAIAALPQVECLSFGIMDFVSAHYGAIPASAMTSPGQFTHPLVVRAKLEIAAACHANGKVASHNVSTEIADTGVVARDAQLAAQQFGYMRMWSIHPSQIRPIVAAFTPATDEINDAVAILEAAMAAQWAPIQHKGKLHDRASYRYFWTVLQRATLSGAAVPAWVNDRHAADTRKQGAPA